MACRVLVSHCHIGPKQDVRSRGSSRRRPSAKDLTEAIQARRSIRRRLHACHPRIYVDGVDLHLIDHFRGKRQKARRHQNDRRLTVADEVAPCVLGRASCDAGIATIAALLLLSHQLVTAPARHRPRTLLSALNAKSNAASSQLYSD